MSNDQAHAGRCLLEGKHLSFRERNRWEYVERPGISGIVVILGLTAHGGLVLVSQWREPVASWVIELPAGLAGDVPGQAREPLPEAARRELLEETGFEAQSFSELLKGPPSAGISSEVVTFFMARKLRRTGPGGGVGEEGIRTHVIPPGKLFWWLEKMSLLGAMVDPKVLAGLSLLRQYGTGEQHD